MLIVRQLLLVSSGLVQTVLWSEHLVSTGALSLIFVWRSIGVHFTSRTGVLVEVLSVDGLSYGHGPPVHQGRLSPGPTSGRSGSLQPCSRGLVGLVTLLSHTLVGRAGSLVSHNLVRSYQGRAGVGASQVPGVCRDLFLFEPRRKSQ